MRPLFYSPGHLFIYCLLLRHAACQFLRFRMPMHLAALAPLACCLTDFPIPHAGPPWGTCFPGMLLTEFPDSTCQFTSRYLLLRHAAWQISQFHMPVHPGVPVSPACCLPNFPIPHAGSPCGTCFPGMLLTEFPNSTCQCTSRHLLFRHAAYRIPRFHMPVHPAALAPPACCRECLPSNRPLLSLKALKNSEIRVTFL